MIAMILLTQSTAVLHNKYLNDELKLLCYNISLRLHRIPPSFPCSEKSLRIPGLWPPCDIPQVCWWQDWLRTDQCQISRSHPILESHYDSHLWALLLLPRTNYWLHASTCRHVALWTLAVMLLAWHSSWHTSQPVLFRASDDNPQLALFRAPTFERTQQTFSQMQKFLQFTS